MQITVNMENQGSVIIQVTVRDLLAGIVPPVLSPTWISPKSSPISISVEADDHTGQGEIQWSAQDATGVQTGGATVTVNKGQTIDAGA